MSDPLAALSAAWTTTFVAMALFTAVVALSTVWDGANHVHALRNARIQIPVG